MEAMKEHASQRVSGGYPVVGIGASAGGLEALTALLSHLSSTTGMACVVVQHQDPSHPSFLPDLLARVTRLLVREVEEGMAAEPDCVYICPPHAELSLDEGIFQLSPSPHQQSGRPVVIDRLFTSLAHAQGKQAVGVLLSGTGSDGTAGLQAIRAAGGITFAQEPASAAFPQMPQNAIESGCVDHVLPCEEIARALAQLGSQAFPARLQPVKVTVEEDAEKPGLSSVLHLLSTQSGVDFFAYKPATLQRRIESRMALLHLAHLPAYAAYLKEHPDEIETLAQSALIAVTDFFRDPPAFEALARLIWPALVPLIGRREPLRIWVPGCATGEEAYSLAISLLEFLQARDSEQPFQIFASDVNPRVIAQARAGIYPTSALATISPERLQRYFTPVDRQRLRYRIDASLRERCVFALHNLLHDPPFTRMDLISCRNVLIYLRASVQQQILQTFHYALVPEGFLLLGTSESVEPLSRLFRRVEPGQHLYRKHAFGSTLLPRLGMNPGTANALTSEEGGPAMNEERSLEGGDVLQEADRLLLANYVPASVVIDANQEIVQIRGQTSPYLELAAGRANLNLFRMARPGLSLGLRTALRGARKERRTTTREGLHVTAFGRSRLVRVTAIPLKGSPADPYCLVLFEEQEDTPDTHLAASAADGPVTQADRRERKQRRITELEEELSTLHNEVQAMLEEREAANEDVQTANEELRSLNEELETSKEELQTLNEELSTANQELSTRNDQLKAAQEYTDAIVETVRSPLVVLSEELRVERANMAFYQFFQTVPPETERCLLTDLGNGQWDVSRLQTLLQEILPANHSFQDFEVEHFFPRIGHKTLLLNGRRLLLEHQPVKKHRILLAMEDVTERRATERLMQARLIFLQHLLDALPGSVYLVQGADARLVLANRAVTQLWGASWRVGQPLLDFLGTNHISIFDTQGKALLPDAFATMRALHDGQAVVQFQEVIRHADGTTLPVLVNAVPIKGPALLAGLEATVGTEQTEISAPVALVVHQDVRVLKEAEELKDHFLGLVAHELRTPLSAVKGFASMLLTQTARGRGPSLAEWQSEAIAEIDLGADRLTLITRDLLDAVRLQAGRLVLHRTSLDLLSTMRRVIVRLQQHTDHHQFTLTTVPASLPQLLVQADGDRLEQVFSNLFINAIKYSPRGGEIEVILREEQRQGTALVSIRDQGIGIPQADQARLFGRFVRAANGEAQGIDGLGLGLYLCRELVAQHEGQIWFESHEEAGSTFFVRLPLASDH